MLRDFGMTSDQSADYKLIAVLILLRLQPDLTIQVGVAAHQRLWGKANKLNCFEVSHRTHYKAFVSIHPAH